MRIHPVYTRIVFPSDSFTHAAHGPRSIHTPLLYFFIYFFETNFTFPNFILLHSHPAASFGFNPVFTESFFTSYYLTYFCWPSNLCILVNSVCNWSAKKSEVSSWAAPSSYNLRQPSCQPVLSQGSSPKGAPIDVSVHLIPKYQSYNCSYTYRTLVVYNVSIICIAIKTFLDRILSYFK